MEPEETGRYKVNTNKEFFKNKLVEFKMRIMGI